MRSFFILFISFLVYTRAKAGYKDSTIYFNLLDSVKAVQFMAEIKIENTVVRRKLTAGITVFGATLSFSDYKGKRNIFFQMHEHSRTLSSGENVINQKYGGNYISYPWQTGNSYKLLIAMASDSASRLCIFSAYLFLPEENKWKFIACRRHPFYEDRIKQPTVLIRSDKKTTGDIVVKEVWIQRSNGSWKNLKDENLPPPVINVIDHVDSAQQRQKEIKQINDSIAAGKTNAKQNVQGVYYEILNSGTGRQVTIHDTVTVHYKGSLFSEGTVFDQTKNKPATFPLKRLIRGWQVGVPLLKVGGKIKLIIPSDMAYSIRTRSAKIPPNSILVFEVEVLDAKPGL